MTPLIKKAQKGNRDAFIELYELNKQKVLYLCNLLLCDANSALRVCANTFKGSWQFILDGKVESEREFEELVINKAVNNCKNKIYKNDSKAFKIPQNKNFNISDYSINNFSNDEDICYLALMCFPAIHRFIYVLDAYLQWSEDDIAELLYTKAENVKFALDSRKNNLERFAYAVKQEQNKIVSINEPEFCSYLYEGERKCEVDAEIDSVVISGLDLVIEPIVKSNKKKQRKIFLIVGISLIVAIVLTLGIVGICMLNSEEEASDYETEDMEDEYFDYSSLPWTSTIESPTQYAIIDIAKYGKIELALDSSSAPITVENFVNLAKDGFYDGLTFHRIIYDFMMQGGDPNADGTGGKVDADGNKINIEGEFYDNGHENYLSHTRGAISMARSDDYNSASSQFFIVQEDCSVDLDGLYAVFGYVVEGLEVVDDICNNAKPTDGNGTIEKDTQPVITSVKIYTPDEYKALKDAEAYEASLVIEAKVAEVSAINKEKFFLTVYDLTNTATDYKIKDAAKVDFSKYKETEKIEKYIVSDEAKVYEAKDGALVEFEASKIVADDMIIIYTDSNGITNIVVYHKENEETEETEKSEGNDENAGTEEAEGPEGTEETKETE